MKMKFIVSTIVLAGAAMFVPAQASATSIADVFELMFSKNVDRSEDLDAARSRSNRQVTMSRGEELFEAGKEMRQGTSSSDYRIRSRYRRTPDYYDVETPGLQPWEALTYKSRVKKAYDLTNQYDMRFQKPEIEAKRKVVRYDRKYRSNRGELSGQRSGKAKLYRLYFQ